jgi:hypothetical protein
MRGIAQRRAVPEQARGQPHRPAGQPRTAQHCTPYPARRASRRTLPARTEPAAARRSRVCAARLEAGQWAGCPWKGVGVWGGRLSAVLRDGDGCAGGGVLRQPFVPASLTSIWTPPPIYIYINPQI